MDQIEADEGEIPVDVIICTKDARNAYEYINSAKKVLRGTQIKVITTTEDDAYIVRENLNLFSIKQLESNLSGARNTGLLLAENEYILFMDDSILPKKGLVERMLSILMNGEYDVVGCHVKPLCVFLNCSVLDPEYNWLIGCTTPITSRPIGSFFMIKRDITKKGLKFPEDYGLGGKYRYGEDTWLFNRLRCTMVDDYVFDVIRWVDMDKLKFSNLIKRAFWTGYSKGKMGIRGDEESKKHLIHYLTHPSLFGMCVVFATTLGYIVGAI